MIVVHNSGFVSETTSKLDLWIQIRIRALNGWFYQNQPESGIGFGKSNTLLVCADATDIRLLLVILLLLWSLNSCN